MRYEHAVVALHKVGNVTLVDTAFHPDGIHLDTTSLVQGGTPQVHVAQEGIDGRVGHKSLRVLEGGVAVGRLSLHTLHVDDKGVEDHELVRSIEVFHFSILVDDLRGVGNVLKGTEQVEIVQGAQGGNLCPHLAPLTGSELLVVGKYVSSMVENLVAVVDGCVETAPVEIRIGRVAFQTALTQFVVEILGTGALVGGGEDVGVRAKVAPEHHLLQRAAHAGIGSIAYTLKVILVFPEILFHNLSLGVDGQPILAGGQGCQSYSPHSNLPEGEAVECLADHS